MPGSDAPQATWEAVKVEPTQWMRMQSSCLSTDTGGEMNRCMNQLLVFLCSAKQDTRLRNRCKLFVRLAVLADCYIIPPSYVYCSCKWLTQIAAKVAIAIEHALIPACAV